jgi:hypothetical protein
MAPNYFSKIICQKHVSFWLCANNSLMQVLVVGSCGGIFLFCFICVHCLFICCCSDCCWCCFVNSSAVVLNYSVLMWLEMGV